MPLSLFKASRQPILLFGCLSDVDLNADLQTNVFTIEATNVTQADCSLVTDAVILPSCNKAVVTGLSLFRTTR